MVSSETKGSREAAGIAAPFAVSGVRDKGLSRCAVESAAVGMIYLVAAQLGQLVAIPPGNVTAVWPPSGIALAAVLLRGFRVLPGVWAAGMLANLLPYFDTPRWGSLVIVGAGAGVMLQALVGAVVVRCWAGGTQPLQKVRTTLVFLVAAAPVCVISSSVGTTCLWGGGVVDADAVPRLWLTWFLGDTAGVILFGPLALAWCVRRPIPMQRNGWLEASGYTLCMAAALALIFFGEELFRIDYPLMVLLLPALMWAALRFGPRGATLVLVFVSSIAVWSTANGIGPFVSYNQKLGMAK